MGGPVPLAFPAVLVLAGGAPPPERPRLEAYSGRPGTAGESGARRGSEDRIEAAREGNQTRRP